MTIKILSEQTINKIAAGEVIERPSSVVKELIENSIDAKATRIEIEIKAGGQRLIRVSDNGYGMNSDDAVLCLERHATSKIRNVEDLFVLRTMGFRGEALASIAAISRMTLQTAEKEALGTLVEIEGGRILNVKRCGRAQGTTVEVHSLFYNVPARKKFQKSISVSGAEITKIVAAMSLGYPEIAFTLIQNEETIFNLLGGLKGSFEELLLLRIRQVLGDQYFLPAPYSTFEKGWISAPVQTRLNRSGQYLFLNRRLITSSLISYAVKDGYGTRIPSDRYPLFVLHLLMPQDQIDVNVHPQKKEVRFSEEETVKRSIQEMVAESLGGRKVFIEQSSSSFFSFPPLSLKEERAFEPLLQELPLERSKPRPIGLFSSFFFLDEGKKMRIVDLKAALARICFEALHRKEKEKQHLLFPITMTLSPGESRWIETQLKEIEQMGFSIRSFGENSFIIDAIPIFMKSEEAQEFIEQMAQEPSFKLHLPEIVGRFVRARKSHFVLEEALGLFDKLMQTTSPYQCPQGKATMVEVDANEIAKLFQKS